MKPEYKVRVYWLLTSNLEQLVIDSASYDNRTVVYDDFDYKDNASTLRNSIAREIPVSRG